MSDEAVRTPRRDATRNRERLLAAARRLFAEQGADVALDEVARAAEVSRTTIYRNFDNREQLAATLFEDNVAYIERRAAELGDAPDAVVTLFDFVLAEQFENRSLSRVLSGAEIAWLAGLSARVVDAFRPLLDRGREAGIVHEAVDVDDLVVAFSMAAGAIADHERAGRELTHERARGMLHRALFTTG